MTLTMVNKVRRWLGLAPAPFGDVSRWRMTRIELDVDNRGPTHNGVFASGATITVSDRDGDQLEVNVPVVMTTDHQMVAIKLPWSTLRWYGFAKGWVLIERAKHRISGPFFSERHVDEVLTYMAVHMEVASEDK